jgi:hypothetical protein
MIWSFDDAADAAAEREMAGQSVLRRCNPPRHTLGAPSGTGGDEGLALVKRERWTEAELLALPAGEHDYIERKAAAFLAESRGVLAKAVSAFANSGRRPIRSSAFTNNGANRRSRGPRRADAVTRDWLGTELSPILGAILPLQTFESTK